MNCLVQLAQLAPLGTFLIALCAFLFAIYSLYQQRLIASRKAAIDFFLKTEIDNYALTMWKEYRSALEILQQTPDDAKFSATSEFKTIRAYLNLFELMAVGIQNGAFDENTCYEFWGDELDRACIRGKRVIDYTRKLPGCGQTYHAIIQLHSEWKRKLDASHRNAESTG